MSLVSVPIFESKNIMGDSGKRGEYWFVPKKLGKKKPACGPDVQVRYSHFLVIAAKNL